MNTQERKGIGRWLAEHPVIIIISLIGSCLAIFVFVTGYQSLRDIFGVGITSGQEPSSSAPQCYRTAELGPWTQGGSVIIDARDGWVQADFWSPNGALVSGYDEVSVIFEPGLRVEVVGVAGDGWKYDASWSQQDVEYCTQKHITNSENIRHKKLTLISVSQLCSIVICR